MSISRLFVLAAASAFVLSSCGAIPGAPKLPDTPSVPTVPGAAAKNVDPNTCGNYAAKDAGRKLKSFLKATVNLEKTVKENLNYTGETCKLMGKELKMPVGELEGSAKDVCARVSVALKDNIRVGVKPKTNLKVKYTPAKCTVDINAVAKTAAKCEAKAEADVSVRCDGVCKGTCSAGCSGSCSGTCNGICDGKCSATNADGQCAGSCDGACSGSCEGSCGGSCSGSCSGSCEGNASVDADASCKAEAEVDASISASCTTPDIEVSIDPKLVVDTSKAEAAMAAVKIGMGRILYIKSKISGPVKAAFATWSASAKELAIAAPKLVNSLGDQAMCVLSQVRGAANMLTSIQVSIEVQVEVSASMSASAGM